MFPPPNVISLFYLEGVGCVGGVFEGLVSLSLCVMEDGNGGMDWGDADVSPCPPFSLCLWGVNGRTDGWVFDRVNQNAHDKSQDEAGEGEKAKAGKEGSKKEEGEKKEEEGKAAAKGGKEDRGKNGGAAKK